MRLTQQFLGHSLLFIKKAYPSGYNHVVLTQFINYKDTLIYDWSESTRLHLFILGLLAQFEVRLKPPASDPGATNRGTVLIRYNSTSAFGSVCDDGWDLSDANVACRMLGFSYAHSLPLS